MMCELIMTDLRPKARDRMLHTLDAAVYQAFDTRFARSRARRSRW